MIKLAANAFLATKISFINEIANVCEETGADVLEVARGHGPRPADRHALPAARASGSAARCFPKDVSALKQLAGNSGYHFQLLTAVIEVNELQKRRVVGKLQKHLGSLVGKRIALLGLAFKANTDDMREASSLVLVRPAAGRRRPRQRLRPGRRGGGAQADGRRRVRRHRRSTRSTARTPRSSSPSGRSSRELDWARGGRADGRPAGDRRAQLRSTREAVGRRASRTRASAARAAATAMQALILVGGEGTRLRPLTSTMPKPVVPLAGRPFITYMLDVAAPPRRRRGDPRLRVPGRRDARRARRREALGLRLRYLEEPEPLGHRRRAEVRRGPARRALLHAQRRRPDRHRPDRPARPARADRRPGDAGADAGRGPVGLRARAAQRGPLGARVRREASAGPDRHQPDQRRRLHPRAQRARRDGAGRARRSRSSARCSRRSSATGCSATRPPATGSTSAPRPLPAGHLRHPRGHRPDRDRRRAGGGRRRRSSTAPRSRDASSRPRWSARAPTIAAGRDRRRRARCSGAACAIGEGAHVESSVLLDGVRVGARSTVRGAILGAAASRSASDCQIEAGVGARRGGHARGGQHPARRRAYLPGRGAARRSDPILSTTTDLSRRGDRRRRPRRSARRTSSACPTSCAMRCGACESANLEPHDSPGGLIVAGMGGSAIGGALARAALGDRASRPIMLGRGYELPAWTTPDTTVLCASYSGNTEETLAVFEAAGALGARRIVCTTGGKLAAAARARRGAGDPAARRLPAPRGRRLLARGGARGGAACAGPASGCTPRSTSPPRTPSG